jgi:2-dehydropantoate 2-reductase
MRVAFVGSGGLGGYFGPRLCKGGAAVHFIARGKHLQAMKSEGLRVEGPEPIRIPQVNASEDPGEVGVVELGQAKGITTPLNRAIADILALHATGK